MDPNGAMSCFFPPINPDLADIWGRTYFDFDNFYFLGSQISRLLNFQIPGSWNQVLGYGWLRLGRGCTSRHISAVSGQHFRSREFRRSKEPGNTVRNPSVQAQFGEYIKNRSNIHISSGIMAPSVEVYCSFVNSLFAFSTMLKSPE